MLTINANINAIKATAETASIYWAFLFNLFLALKDSTKPMVIANESCIPKYNSTCELSVHWAGIMQFAINVPKIANFKKLVI